MSGSDLRQDLKCTLQEPEALPRVLHSWPWIIVGLGIGATTSFFSVVSAVLLALIATLAGYLPALRASRTDPAVVLRSA